MKRIAILLCVLSVAGCAGSGSRQSVKNQIDKELDAAVKVETTPSKQEEVNNALLPPLAVPGRKTGEAPAETQFDLVVSNTPAQPATDSTHNKMAIRFISHSRSWSHQAHRSPRASQTWLW